MGEWRDDQEFTPGELAMGAGFTYTYLYFASKSSTQPWKGLLTGLGIATGFGTTLGLLDYLRT